MRIMVIAILALATAGDPAGGNASAREDVAAQRASTETDDRHRPATRRQAASWSGRFIAGNETIAFTWHDGLVLELGRIRIAVDGRWHETVETFAVRHRASWLPHRRAIGLEERHDEGHAWRYLLRLELGARTLLKTAWPEPGGADPDPPVLRRFLRDDSPRSTRK